MTDRQALYGGLGGTTSSDQVASPGLGPPLIPNKANPLIRPASIRLYLVSYQLSTGRPVGKIRQASSSSCGRVSMSFPAPDKNMVLSGFRGLTAEMMRSGVRAWLAERVMLSCSVEQVMSMAAFATHFTPYRSSNQPADVLFWKVGSYGPKSFYKS